MLTALHSENQKSETTIEEFLDVDWTVLRKRVRECGQGSLG
jgi:hypothetical protein